MAEWIGALAPIVPCSTLCGVVVLWVRVPSLLGHAALPTTGGIGDCGINCDTYDIYDDETNKFAYGREWHNFDEP